MQPLVSILIPAFNTAEFVGDAIRSALAQTWRRTEIIVVDDGSTDGTAAVCRQLAAPTVSVVSRPHRGASAARNEALALCQGDYVQWLDADDLLAADKIERQLAAIDPATDRRTLLSGSWAHFRHRPHRAAFHPSPLWADLSPAEWLRRKLAYGVYMQNATWLVSRELTDAAGPWKTRLSVDNDGEYFCRVLLASDTVRFIPEAKAFYRRRVGSLSVTGTDRRKIEDRFLSTELHVGYLRTLEDSEATREACLSYLQRYFALVYPDRPDLIDQTQRLAGSLGGRLAAPRASWKYGWIAALFGWTHAKRVQVTYNRYKSAALNRVDAVLARLESGPSGGGVS